LIDDASMLREVSRAYDRIALTAYLESKAWDLAHDPTAMAILMQPGIPRPLERAMGAVEAQDRFTEAAIAHARSMLKAAIVD
jgi:hypothetical protein